MPEYVYHPYPACRYHPTKPAIVVRSEAEDLALEAGWVDSPSKFPKAKPPKAEPEPPPVEAPVEPPGLEEPESKARTRRSK